jgi:hypothetical protein
MNDTTPSLSDATEVFISYSSEDRDRIDPIVQLVRAMKKLILYCVDINPEVNCQTQDVIQIWFKTQGEPMYQSEKI